jgi:hypothetical protein
LTELEPGYPRFNSDGSEVGKASAKVKKSKEMVEIGTGGLPLVREAT